MAIPTQLLEQIIALKDEFQHVADHHEWLCLGIAPSQQQFLAAGEMPPTPDGKYLGEVDVPRTNPRRVVARFVDALTEKAIVLLRLVVDHDSAVPSDVRADIRERSARGGGWVRWLWYNNFVQHVHRIEHYAQAAATALWSLAEHCRSQPARETFDDRLRFDATTLTVFLDGKPIPVNDPAAFRLYRILATRRGVPVTRQQLRQEGIKGDKAVPRLRAKLPTRLQRTIRSGHSGYWLQFPKSR